MFTPSRADNSAFGQWWWSVDRWLLACLLILIGIGVFLVTAASPPVAQRIGLPAFHFTQIHIIAQGIGLILMIGISFCTPRQLRLLGLALAGMMLFCLVLTLFMGEEIKGARRWIHLPGFSLQAAELMKPAFAIVSAWLLARGMQNPTFPGRVLSMMLYGLCVTLLLLQPDLGMTVIFTLIWGAEMFLSGIALWLVGGMMITGVCGLVGAYFLFPHVTARVDKFLNPEATDTYQINQALSAFRHGGWLGTGPGQGEVKFHIPDAHADFVFAVAGEELGTIACILLLGLFGFIFLRSVSHSLKGGTVFSTLALGGLLTEFIGQALIHTASNLQLIPTKGMTLPFLSYGGSASIGMGITMGAVLALTRRNHREQDQ